VAFEIFLKERNIKKKGLKQQIGDGEKEEEEEEEEKKKRKRGGKEEEGGSQDSKKRRKGDAHADEDRPDKQRGDTQKNGEEESEESDEKWSDLEAYISILEEGPLCPLNFDPSDNGNARKKSSSVKEDERIQMPHGPDGLRYHIIDIWLDELAKVIDDHEEKEGASNGTSAEKLKERSNIPMDLLLRPFEKLKAESPTKTVRVRASEVLDDERLVEWGFRTKPVSDDEDDDEDDEWGGFD
jgi:ribosomal RNA-processing protein 1